jgi:lipid-A-disaccharide synthase
MVAGEHSGDRLGGPLIAALRQKSDRTLQLNGVGGEAMAGEGCPSLFPLSEIAVMGPVAILKRCRSLVRRVHQTVDVAVEMNPDALVILDSPEFTHAVAKRVRRRLPDIPVIDYVSPSVWAWRPGRARKMRRYIDHVLAILPFEPAAHERLGGPACTYVGHPLIERLDWIGKLDTRKLARRLGMTGSRPVIVVLPGSRASEIERMMPVLGRTIELIVRRAGPVDILLPVADGMENKIHAHLSTWSHQPHIVHGEEDKFTAFRFADAALATSGTVTLELALSGTPMIVGYRTDFIVSLLRWMLKAHSIVLPNLVLRENVFPEYIQKACSAKTLCNSLLPLLDTSSAAYKRQHEALSRIKKVMQLPSGTPSEHAARIVLDVARPA